MRRWRQHAELSDAMRERRRHARLAQATRVSSSRASHCAMAPPTQQVSIRNHIKEARNSQVDVSENPSENASGCSNLGFELSLEGDGAALILADSSLYEASFMLASESFYTF